MADKPVLAAIDFSQYSEQVVLWAARAARGFKAPLVVLHVVHDPSSAPGYYQQEKKRDKHLQRIEEVATESMDAFLADMAKKHPKLLADLDHRLVVGLPVTRIIEIAEDIDAQLIVMGSRGRTGLPHLLLGSKAEKVVQMSPIPVTIIKGSTKAK